MNKTITWIIITIFVMILVNKQCEQEPKTIIETKTVTTTIHDTIIKTVISKPKEVFRTKVDTVYKITRAPIDTTSIKANQYTTELNSNNATAKLNITTSGELYDVSGVITYPEKETTTTITKYKDKSGLYLYTKVPFSKNFHDVEAGALYQFKNTVMIMGGVQYDNLTKQVNATIGVGIKIL